MNSLGEFLQKSIRSLCKCPCQHEMMTGRGDFLKKKSLDEIENLVAGSSLLLI